MSADNIIHKPMSLQTEGAPPATSPSAEEIDPNAAPAAEGSDANPAESSPADDKGAKPDNLLSVVKSAIEPEEVVAAPPPAEGEGEVKPAAEGEAKPEGQLTPEAQAEADAKLPFHEHPRWKQVLAERDGYKDDAGRFRQMEGYMREHALLPSEVAEGFDVMAKLKSGDPAKLGEVRDYFASRLEFLNKALGHELPDDLRQRVESGALDEEGAQELAKARAAEALRTTKTEAETTRQAEENARTEAVTNATAMATAVDEWEQKQKASDPDYAKKATLVLTTCRAIVQETGKPPSNPVEAVALSEAAKKRVDEHFKQLAPTPKPIRRDPAGSSAPTVAEPQSLRDAIANSLRG